jgi:hypothetical protein
MLLMHACSPCGVDPHKGQRMMLPGMHAGLVAVFLALTLPTILSST